MSPQRPYMQLSPDRSRSTLCSEFSLGSSPGEVQTPAPAVPWQRRTLGLGLATALLATGLLTWRGSEQVRGLAGREVSRQADVKGKVEAFSILGTYKGFTRGEPFRFRCPLPFMSAGTLRGTDLQRSCCHDYDAMPLQWPYQFPECRAESNCSSCWRHSDEGDLRKSPVAGLAAAGYAASLAVSTDLHIGPSTEKQAARRLVDGTKHAGLPFHQILGKVRYGLRQHVSDACPLVGDWEEYYLTDEERDTHARIFRSASAKLAIVAFRGTQLNSGKNWATDSDVEMMPLDLGDGTRAYVHRGFETALQGVLPHTRDWVEGYVDKNLQGMFQVPQDWKLVFTGHSLGGALATLAATHAEVEKWSRRPDAVITFGSPRVADGNLSRWWQERGMCGRLLRVTVHNDPVHWMPFSMGGDLIDSVFSCTMDLQGCWGKVHKGLHSNAQSFKFSQRWTHVCPRSEFEVPGALKGINPELRDFSPLGGALAHFLSNGLFGYGYGVVQGGLLLHDAYCGLTESIFPQFECSTVEDLTGIRCLGLHRDHAATSAGQCRKSCCEDRFCEVWQFMRNGACWRGRSRDCRVQDLFAKDVVVSERVH